MKYNDRHINKILDIIIFSYYQAKIKMISKYINWYQL